MLDRIREFAAQWAASLFPHEKRTRWLLLAFAAVLIASMATTCRADAIVFEGGSKYLRGPAAAIVASTRWDAPRDANWEAGLVLVGTDEDGRSGVAGVQALYVDGFGKFDIGLGVAYFNRVHHQLGSEMNFSLLVGYRITDRWQVNVRHWSNAGTTDNNTGLDIATISYRF